MSWQRYEIENYLLHLDALERFVAQRTHRRTDGGTFIGQFIESALEELFNIVPGDTRDLGDLRVFARAKASEDILIPLLRKVGLTTGKRELFELAAAMKPDEIHPDVKGVFDKIAEVFKLDRGL